MAPKRQARLPSNSSKLEFVDKDREKSSSKRCVVRSFLAFGLSLAAIGLIVVVIVVWFPPNSSFAKKAANNSGEIECSFSDEAKRVGLEGFLQRMQSEFYEHHPHLIAMKPAATSGEIRQTYRPYNFHPEAIKNVTDAGVSLYNELQFAIFAVVKEQKLKLRERKALYVAKNVLKEAFGWDPFEQNYYAGDWMLGPNIFCWQPACKILTHLQISLPHFKPTSLSDLKELQQLLQKHRCSIEQYKKNLKQAPKIGMVRSAEACKVGVREFKKRFLPITLANETG